MKRELADYHETEQIENRVGSKIFEGGIEATITYVDCGSDRGAFNLHLDPRSWSTGNRIHSWEILPRIGFKRSTDCPVYGRHSHGCYYKSLEVSRRGLDKTDLKNNAGYRRLKSIAETIAGICSDIAVFQIKLENLGLAYPWDTDHFPYGTLEAVKPEVWFDKIKPVEYSELEQKRDECQEKIRHLDEIIKVLHTQGKELEEAVAELLSDLGDGIVPEPQDTAERNAPIDLKVTLPGIEEDRRFAVEITGTKSGVRKDDKKAHDILVYLNFHQGDDSEKVILLANTYFELDPDERHGRLHFSDEVKNPLGKQGVLLMTTVQLYEIWRGVKESRLNLREVIEQMYSQVGEFILE